MQVVIDFETRSACDIKKRGSWVYSEHPTTQIICCAAKVDGEAPFIWFPWWSWDMLPEDHDLPIINDREMFTLLRTADVISAFNMPFERGMWVNVATPQYGWPAIPVEKLRCSAAKAAYHALPRSLDGACKALALPVQKDNEGYKLMLKMCKPRRPTKNNPAVWHEEPADIVRLARYCIQDVEAEYALSEALADLPAKELAIWRLDQEINARGIQADVESARRMVEEIAVYEKDLLGEVARLTNQRVNSPKQIAASKDWLASMGVETETLDKNAVTALLAREDLPQVARRFLEIRRELGKSSTSKYQGILDRACKDGRIRGAFVYHGCGTGRWSGSGVQPQNLSRGSISDPETALDALHVGGFALMDLVWGRPMDVAASCIRSVLTAAPGKELVCADFSSIEARVNAWVAGETKVLEAFRSGKDLYKVSAGGIFNTTYDKVDKQQRQVGKVSTLSLGYSGGIGAFASMAKNYGIDLETLPAFVLQGFGDEDTLRMSRRTAGMFLKKNPGAMSADAATACDIIKTLWRRANTRIVDLWARLEEAAISAVANPGGVYTYAGIQYGVVGGFLKCRLPSGRFLHYYEPEIVTKKTDWGNDKSFIAYWSINQKTRQWEKSRTNGLYGGLLCENICQAISRDFTAEAIVRLERAGYPVVLHVHDEVVSEVDAGFGSLTEFEQIVAASPTWAAGCPISAEGWRNSRYRK